MARAKPKKPRILVADFETDPFQYRVKPQVFLTGVCDGEKTIQWWGDQSVPAFCDYLGQQTETTYVFFHNGGKFDFFYLPWPLHDPIKIINGRIVSAKPRGASKVTLRDSFAFLPFALSAYAKTEIDYEKFKASEREKHRGEIEAYHRDDLTSTYALVSAFIERFGLRLTIASTAIKELNKLCPVDRKGEHHDQKFRPYYFGGRVEAFERGHLAGPWRLYDVNSMYPFAMANYNHPTGTGYEFICALDKLLADKRPGFAKVHGRAHGCFPLKTEEGRLEFPHDTNTYRVTLYELREAVRLSLFECDDVEAGYIAVDSQNFAPFVRVWSDEKIAARRADDKKRELFAKLILNSAYGKFGSNPDNYYDYRFLMADEPWPVCRCTRCREWPDPLHAWEPFEDWGWLVIARRPSATRPFSYFDVATAASITGAARARLMKALAGATRPIYCDTDSIICEAIGEPVGEALGEWKLEAEADAAIVLEKKTYALVKNGELVKSAAKGVKMTLKDYFDVANGKEYTYFRDAPTFRRDGSAQFINRTIKGVTQ